MAIIKLENVTCTYPHVIKPALRDFSIEINEGEFIALMGPNSSGKTTFCKLINAVIPHSHGGKLDGSVWVDGLLTADTPVPVLESRVAAVHDDPDTQLFTTSVRDEIAFGPENLCVLPHEIEEKVRASLEVSGFYALRDMPPTALSGGQKQRLAIAAALAMEPRILVLDEPTSQLDPLASREVLHLIASFRKRGLTVIMATHNSEEAAAFADKICVLHEGKPVAYDKPQEIFCNDLLFREKLIRRPDVSELAVYLANKGKPLPVFPVCLNEAKSAILEWHGV